MSDEISQSGDGIGHVVVIGGTSGIGLATAIRAERHFAARVTAGGRTAAHLQNARRALSPAATVAPVDVTRPESVESFFEATGQVDHLVVSLAGGAALGPFRDIGANGIATTLEVKLFGYLTTIRHALPRLGERGSITLVTGMAARRPARGITSLSIANGALEALVGVLALELPPIRVNAVSPGVIRTPAWDRLPEAARDALFENTARETPLRRVGDADEVAAAILGLITNEFLTGVILPCDGGMGVA